MIDWANILLILLGVALVASGPWIIFTTVRGILKATPPPSKGAKVYNVLSDGLNFVIAILFFFAGILFIINNLRGNPIPQ